MSEKVEDQQKKRKRPWRNAVRKAAKKAKLEGLKSKLDVDEESKKEFENIIDKRKDKKKLLKKKIKKKRHEQSNETKEDKINELQEKLKSSRFRYINEQLYTMSSKDAVELFENDEVAFKIYHEGYRNQALKWPVNPVDKIIKKLRKLPEGTIIADLGCGDAKIAKTLGKKLDIKSFDLVANNELVTACDMANLPLEKESVDGVVFCLSLMGTNLSEFLREAHRILKLNGKVYIAEVWSRFKNLKKFLNALKQLGFKVLEQNLINDYFQMVTLEKIGKIQQKKPLGLLLEPCYYKKR